MDAGKHKIIQPTWLRAVTEVVFNADLILRSSTVDATLPCEGYPAEHIFITQGSSSTVMEHKKEGGWYPVVP
jgi:hypothetical protein